MKTKLSTFCILSLLLAACDDKTVHSSETNKTEARPRGTHNGVLLTTELPPELIEGTPRPIQIPGYRVVTRMSPEVPQSMQVNPDAGFPHPAPVNSERYGEQVDNSWQLSEDAPLSTFSIDVDTASYANVRRMILDGHPIPPDAVRLEEMVNYFDYAYPQPVDDHPFAVHVDNATCPWNPEHQLVRVALNGREIDRAERPPANLVFLLDVSGSMNDPRKLPLVIASLELMLEEMNDSDTLSIVVYAGAEGLALSPTACNAQGRNRILAALRSFRAGGSTNGGAGIKLAYQIAREQFKDGGINRVILATDGDFNVGVTHDGGLVGMVAENAKDNIYLTVIGTGTGNLNDSMLEAITNKGNGVYHYIDSMEEARVVFLQKMMGNLVTIAKDVKIQVEFNPDRVRGYRLLGYANRMLRKEDFANDRIDAGDIGSGHTVTAFYEVQTGNSRDMASAGPLRYSNPQEHEERPATSNEWLSVNLRYKQPEGERSTLMTRNFTGVSRDFAEADDDFRFGSSVAMAAMIFRKTEGLDGARFEDASRLAAASLGSDPHGDRAGFVALLNRLSANSGR